MDKFFDKLPYEQLAKIKPQQLFAGAAGVALLLIAVFYFTLYAMQKEEFDNQVGKRKQTETQITRYQGLIAERESVQRLFVNSHSELTQFKEQMPRPRDIIRFFRDVTGAVDALGLRISTIKRQPEVVKDFYTEVPISLSVQGGFFKSVEFLEIAQNMLHLVDLTEFNMEMKKVTQGKGEEAVVSEVLETSSTVIAYTYNEGAENKPAAK